MRVKIFIGTVLFFFFVLILGLYYSQVLRYGFYSELSQKNRIRALSLEAPRGRIYDRKGRLIVNNRISFDVEVIYRELKDLHRVLAILGDVLNIDVKTLARRIERARANPFIPIKIVEDIEKEKAIRIEEMRLDVPGLIVTTRPVRNYLYRDTLSHVVGYLGKISEKELDKYRTYGYRMQDYVGKDGIERSFNEYLRGVNGGLQVEVDSKGRQLRVLAVREPHPGRDIYLTVDVELQELCDSLLLGKKGAIVAIESSTGAVLALASHPNFDPSIFINPHKSSEVARLLTDSKTFPMVNRAIGGTYPLGSVFKILVATAALESRKFNANMKLTCKGRLLIGNRVFHCWREKGHGAQVLTEGIKNSCNVFFYQLGLLLGAEEISKHAFAFGLGRPLGIDLPGEVSGLVPSPAWKKKELKESWYKGETANFSIGQGYLLVTPLQVAHMINVVATGGKIVRPYVVEKIEDVRVHQAGPRNMRLKKSTVNVVKEGLRMVVNERRGTGMYARSKKLIISGKTGTAQNPTDTPHAWFAGFAPFEDPKICVVVFLEHGGKGGLEPAKFTKEIIESAERLELL